MKYGIIDHHLPVLYVQKGRDMFVGRKKEFQFLEERYQSNKAELVVLYGRRRIGKTELLNRFCADKDYVFYSCREYSDAIQLDTFSKEILKKNHLASKYIDSYRSWDEVFQHENIMIVLCGSAMSFIEKEILSEKNPLYGRATGVYKLKELAFGEAVEFFPNYSNEDKMAAYAILGGVPHYLKQFDERLSLL